MNPLDAAWSLIKGRMSDIHVGFQDDPHREMTRLRHEGMSDEAIRALYQQYLDSLGDDRGE